MPKLSIVIDKAQLDHIKRMCKSGGLATHQKPIQNMLRKGSRLMFIEARKRAPVGRGHKASKKRGGGYHPGGETLVTLRDAYGETGQKPWGTGKVVVKTVQGAILNNGGRGTNSIHRNGPRVGKRTRGWLSGTIRLAAVKRGIDALARDALREMEAKWVNG